MNCEHTPSEPKYLFFDTWGGNVFLPDPLRLNRLITEFNEWQIQGFKYNEREKLLALIEFGRQTYAYRNTEVLAFIKRIEDFINVQQYDED